MRRSLFLLAIALVAGLAHRVSADDNAGAKALEGRWIQGQLGFLEPPPGIWKLIYGHDLSLDDPAALVKDRSILSIEGGKLTFKNGDHEKAIKVEIDPEKSPKTIDLVVDKATTFLGIYEIKDGQLRLGIGDGKTRPKTVEIADGEKGRVLIVFSRLKPQR